METTTDVASMVRGNPSQYVKLNVGGSLHYTTIGTLTKDDNMLRAMFSGRMEVLTDSDGWILLGKYLHFVSRILLVGALSMQIGTENISVLS